MPVTATVATYPASYEQEAIWTADHLGGGARYVEAWALRLSGQLDIGAVQWALSEIVTRHEALRTTVVMRDGELVGEVAAPVQLNLVRRDCDPAALDAELRHIVDEPLNGEPIRSTLLTLGPCEFVLVVQIHHIAVDATAFAIIDREFAELYRARLSGAPAKLAPAPRFGDYARAQREGRQDETALSYWREQLRDAHASNAPLTDRPPAGRVGGRAGQVPFDLADDVASGVARICRRAQTTPFAAFAAALAVVIARSNSSDEVIVGTPVSRRGDVASEGMIGCLTDLLPLRIAVEPGQDMVTLLRNVHETIWQAVVNKDVAYARLLSRAAPRAFRRVALCPTVIVVDDVRRPTLDLPSLTAERIDVPLGWAKFALCLTVIVTGRRYDGWLEYDRDLYDEPTVCVLVEQLLAVLVAAAGDGNPPINRLLGLPR